MDERKLQATMHALEWEARYRKRASGQDTGNAFLRDLATLDGDFAETLSSLGVRSGRLLEIGAGLGEQAIQYALRGFDVTATEVSDTAIGQASVLAHGAGAKVAFVNDNILFTRLDGQFDIIADRGCYTTLPWDFLGNYARNIARLLAPDGHLLLKVDTPNQAKIKALQDNLAQLSCISSHYRRGLPEADGRPPDAVFAVFRHFPAQARPSPDTPHCC
ncbi:MAG TPA: class I SAM-dependent methyltransferase [Rhodocyclaceae bacterium]|nr:class I SAM-dependent methyltransferase [Rhodocyclaceae bacterium]